MAALCFNFLETYSLRSYRDFLSCDAVYWYIDVRGVSEDFAGSIFTTHRLNADDFDVKLHRNEYLKSRTLQVFLV
jgi:hypothetical protein